MKSKHTPGPWLNRTHSISAQSGAIIAKTVDSKVDYETKDANARLIAAAPELLTMLDRLLSEYLTRDPREGHVALLTIEQARAAITKAMGES